MLLFGSMDGSKDQDINHQYKAVVHLEYDSRIEDVIIYFGESEYITTIEDGEKVNWKNDGLRN